MADLPENTWSHQASLEFRAVSNRETLAWCMSAKQGRESALLPELQSCCFLISNYFHTSQLTWHLLVLVSNADSPIESYYLMKTSIQQNHIWLCSQQFAEVVITILPDLYTTGYLEIMMAIVLWFTLSTVCNAFIWVSHLMEYPGLILKSGSVQG